MSAINRKSFLQAVAFPASAETYTAIGLKNNEITTALNPVIDEGEDVLGNVWNDVTGYKPTLSYGYRAESGTPLYTALKQAFEQRYTLDQLKCTLAEADLSTSAADTAKPANRYDAKIIPQSYGGDTTAMYYNFDIAIISNVPVAGTFNMTTKKFTEPEPGEA
jgi:hypothetical protein